MPQKTKTQMNEEFLVRKGYRRVADYPSRKKIVFETKVEGVFYFLGGLGSVRRGRTIGDSVPVKLKLER